MATTVADPLVGRLIDGRYEIVRRIARGGMATVYLAHDRRLDREVALKLMHPHLAEGTDVAARFRREARAAARLAHTGVVQVFDQGSEGDTSYLTMEYVDGTNLRRLLKQAGSLSVEATLDIVIAILDALAAAHRAGFVHRDIKPENVLISSIGVVKVADFGLARAATEATAATTGTLLGTVAYLSPEIITDGIADARADLYAVGVICYELLTGQQPFRGETAIQVAYQHVHDRVPVPSDDFPELPREVDELVSTLASRDAAERPPDAGAAVALARDLRRALPAEALTLRLGVPGTALDPRMSDDPEPEADHGRSSDGATISLRNGSGTISLPIGAVGAEDSDDSEALTARLGRKRRRRRRRLLITLLSVLLIGAGGAGAWWYFDQGPGAYTALPDLIGQSAEEATASLQEERLVAETESDFSDDVAQGHIITTDPEPGSRVHYDSTVTLVVSDGVRMITMPDLDGLDAEGIRSALEQAGWDGQEIAFEQDWSADVAADEFLAGAPDTGDSVAHDEPVHVTLSGGPEPTTIISIVGASADEARSDLEANQLTYAEAEDREFSDSAPEGHVISQVPEAGSDGHAGDEVTVVLSKGPELFEVPSVFGKRFANAQEVLTEAGFEVERSNALGGLLGLVQSQSVAPGQMEPRGTVIVLTVV